MTMKQSFLLLLLSVMTIPSALSAKTKIAFVGLKHSHCWRQLQNVATIPEADFVGVAEPKSELIEETKKYQPDAYYVDDYKKLLEEKQP
jgi:hypothetical protein